MKKVSASSSTRAKRGYASAARKRRGLARELRDLKAKRDVDIDTSDIPEIVDWSGAECGRFNRPVR
jgi:hypothetical protein